jgi:hypothetical protein
LVETSEVRVILQIRLELELAFHGSSIATRVPL